MKTILISLFLLQYLAFSQDVTVSISSNKPTYKIVYGNTNAQDPIYIRYTLHNHTNDSIKVKFEPYFELDYIPNDEPGYGSCFRMYEKDTADKVYYWVFKPDLYSAFVTVPPMDSLVKEGEFDIYWPCRSAPPYGDWEFNIKYSRVLTNEDNFFLFQNRYTDSNSKEFVSAWEGKLESNTINIKLTRPEN